MRVVHWKLKSGGRSDQETAEQKQKAGLEYIEKLGDEVIKVIEQEDKFIIHLKD